MKKINFNIIGKIFVFLLIINFAFIHPYIKENIATTTYNLKIPEGLFYIGSNLYELSKAIIISGVFISLAILFKNQDNK